MYLLISCPNPFPLSIRQSIRQHQGVDKPGVRQVPESNEEQRKMEEIGCEIICGPPTTLAVKGEMRETTNKEGSELQESKQKKKQTTMTLSKETSKQIKNQARPEKTLSED